MTARARGPCASPAPAVTLAKSRAPRWPVQGGCWWPHRVPWRCHRGEPGCPQSHAAHGGSTETSGGREGAGSGHLCKPSCPGRPAAPLGARHVDGGRLPGPCPLSPSPVPLSPPPAVQPRGVPSRRRRVSQLSSAASKQRRVLDNTPAGRGGLAGVESPRGGKKKMKKQKKITSRRWNQSRGWAGGTAWGAPAPGAAPCPPQHPAPSWGTTREATRSCCHPAGRRAHPTAGTGGAQAPPRGFRVQDTGSAPRRGTGLPCRAACARGRHLGARWPCGG